MGIISSSVASAPSMMDVPRARAKRTNRRLAIGVAGVVIAVVLATIALTRPRDRVVPASSVLAATVRQGRMTVSVRGAGRLVPQHVQLVTALTTGQVEEIMVEPGAVVDPESILVKLSNPDIHLQSLQAQQQLTAAEAQLADATRALELARLTQEAQFAASRSERDTAERDARADAELAERQFVPREQARRSAERAAVLAARVEAEAKGIEVLRSSARAQRDRLTEQVRRLKEICDFYRLRLAALQVRAGTSGVVQDLNLQPGQWVQPGTTLARVVGPGGLKAELRVSQMQARDVRAGQRALIDTRAETVEGRVRRVDPNVRDGFVMVEVDLTGDLPRTARPDLGIDGVVIVDELESVLYVDRPVGASSDSVLGLFKLDRDGRSARRVPVRLGRMSVKDVEVRDGLSAGDRVIVSDMSAWDQVDRVALR